MQYVPFNEVWTLTLPIVVKQFTKSVKLNKIVSFFPREQRELDWEYEDHGNTKIQQLSTKVFTVWC